MHVDFLSKLKNIISQFPQTLFNIPSRSQYFRIMITTRIATSILGKSLLSNAARSVYSTAGSEKVYVRQKKPERELKAYEKLFFSSPLMNINIEMIMAINELRPKATYIIATKNGQFPKQISNSTFNIVECLNYIQGFKYFYKSFPALVQNMTKVLVDKIEFSATGLHKVNAMKKFVLMLSHIDCLHGEIFSEHVAVYFMWALESSIKVRNKLVETINPMKQRLLEITQKKKSLKLQSTLSPEDKQTIASLEDETILLEDEIKKQIYKNRFMKEEDFLCGLHYCLQKGYYSETVLREFVENILQRDNYGLPSFEKFLEDEENFFYEKPLSNIYNKRALVYCRMYSSAVYRLKILNELKKMKKYDSKFMDFLRHTKSTEQTDLNESTSEESPFINGQKIDISSSSESTSEEKAEYLTDALVEESLISKKNYINLVNSYLQLLEKKDVLCYILTEQSTSESFRVMQTEFFSFLNEEKNDRQLTLQDVKKRYLNVFKEIFNIQKNGTVLVESPFVETAFEVVLRMYDFTQRKEVFELLKLYERYLVTKSVADIKTLAPFYVFEKYGYKSNFVASKLFEFVNLKYRLGRQEYTIKEELILLGNQICRYLCLYFKLLQGDISSLFSQYDMNASIMKSKVFVKNNNQEKSAQSTLDNKQINVKYQQEFQQAVEIFLHNYNKMISVIYLERENSGFIGKGLELSFQYLRVKYLSTKAYEQNLYVEGKIPEEDIRKIIIENSEIIKSHRSYVKNVYEKEFSTDNKPKSNEKLSESLLVNSVNYNPYVQSMFLRKNAVLNPLDQISVILDIVETAVQLQGLKNMQFYEDVVVVFKNIFENKKLVKILTHHQTFPDLLKKMIRISQLFKGSYKNESNKLFESILNLTGFNFNSFIHTARINIARQILNSEKSVPLQERFQPSLHSLQQNVRIEPNIRIWPTPTFEINKQNVVSQIRSDILHLALIQNSELQKIIRDQLAKIKTVKPNEKIKHIKFQLNYLEYPYLANVAINKNNELIVILVRRASPDSDKPYNAVLTTYYDQCEAYFRKKGNKVIVATNEHEIRNSLRELVK